MFGHISYQKNRFDALRWILGLHIFKESVDVAMNLIFPFILRDPLIHHILRIVNEMLRRTYLGDTAVDFSKSFVLTFLFLFVGTVS